MSKFKKFQRKLEREGYSRKVSAEIAATEGARKYGWEGMAEKAAEARKHHESRQSHGI